MAERSPKKYKIVGANENKLIPYYMAFFDGLPLSLTYCVL